MKKTNKVIIGVVSVLLVTSLVVLLGNTELLQGKFSWKSKLDLSKYFQIKGAIVSVVASPVTSILTSEVTSEVPSEVTSSGGVSIVVSEVTSEVPSAVTSSVASAVTVSKTIANKIDISKLSTLTSSILQTLAQEDYKANPTKYMLSNQEKMRLIELYEKNK